MCHAAGSERRGEGSAGEVGSSERRGGGRLGRGTPTRPSAAAAESTRDTSDVMLGWPKKPSAATHISGSTVG